MPDIDVLRRACNAARRKTSMSGTGAGGLRLVRAGCSSGAREGQFMGIRHAPELLGLLPDVSLIVLLELGEGTRSSVAFRSAPLTWMRR